MNENASTMKERFVEAINSTDKLIKALPEKGTAMWKLCEEKGLVSKAEQANQETVCALEQAMGDKQRYIRDWLYTDYGKIPFAKHNGAWHKYCVNTPEELYDFLTGDFDYDTAEYTEDLLGMEDVN